MSASGAPYSSRCSRFASRITALTTQTALRVAADRLGAVQRAQDGLHRRAGDAFVDADAPQDLRVVALADLALDVGRGAGVAARLERVPCVASRTRTCAPSDASASTNAETGPLPSPSTSTWCCVGPLTVAWTWNSPLLEPAAAESPRAVGQVLALEDLVDLVGGDLAARDVGVAVRPG